MKKFFLNTYIKITFLKKKIRGALCVFWFQKLCIVLLHKNGIFASGQLPVTNKSASSFYLASGIIIIFIYCDSFVCNNKIGSVQLRNVNTFTSFSKKFKKNKSFCSTNIKRLAVKRDSTLNDKLTQRNFVN